MSRSVGFDYKSQMNNIDKLIDTLRYRNIFAEYYQSGGSPAEIKNRIVDTLRPFFTNHDSLEKHAIDFLVPDYVNFNHIQAKYPGIERDIRLVLDTYAAALLKDRETLYDAIKQLIPDIIESGNRFWTFLNLEKDKALLELHEFAKESFDNLDDVIEGLMRSALIENVIVNRIMRKKNFNIQILKSQKLAILVDELIAHSPYAHLFSTQPEGLKLSEWRNIAAHQSYKIIGGTIVCQCGSPKSPKLLSLTRAELYDRVLQIVRTLEVLNLSHKFFGFDNSANLTLESHEHENDSPGRDEIWLLFFVTGLNSLGFDVVQLQFKEHGEALLVVRDLTEADPKRRGIHSSQFIYPIWLFTNSTRITVEYRLKNDDPYIRSSSTSDICQSICNGHHDIEYLAEKVEFQVIGESQQIVPPDRR